MVWNLAGRQTQSIDPRHAVTYGSGSDMVDTAIGELAAIRMSLSMKVSRTRRGVAGDGHQICGSRRDIFRPYRASHGPSSAPTWDMVAEAVAIAGVALEITVIGVNLDVRIDTPGCSGHSDGQRGRTGQSLPPAEQVLDRAPKRRCRGSHSVVAELVGQVVLRHF